MKPMLLRLFVLCVALLTLVFGLRAADSTPAAAGPVNVDKWKSVPCVKGRLATDQDTRAGRAVFVFNGGLASVHPLDIALPHCAIWHDADRREDVPVVCIQAEEKDGKKVVGFRIVKGGLGVGLLSELTLLDTPDARFRK